MLRLVGECDHVLRYGREDGMFNFAAVLGGEGSQDEVLGIISEFGLGLFECWGVGADKRGMIHHVRKQIWQGIWTCYRWV